MGGRRPRGPPDAEETNTLPSAAVVFKKTPAIQQWHASLPFDLLLLASRAGNYIN
jgi:hypothetical protein